ncbi:helix-turn-helix transcriptional regulator [Streptomyces sp. AC602_WCS936]|uniref:helix-turn-helix domain-containing protein n=1 Tax=Streptomyces sp. AC602_WCS936 TaxID=2823685 RepID=UPI001C25A68E|nr:helix-turn-helix transcriptional regulator [Streptomyces sp. AC602_WCS936]
MPASSSVQAARQVLADRLREISKDAGLDGKRLAQACGWHPSKVSRIATAKTSPSTDDIRAWCHACGADDQTEDLVASLRAVEGMWVEWRRMERAGLRQAQQARLPLYERTRWFRSYSPGLIPGLIQTYSYTEDVLQGVQRRRVQVDDVADAVAARMERQRVLYDGHRRFAFLIEEPVLRNALGAPDTQVEQLEHLLRVAALPNVSLGVVRTCLDRSRMPVEGFWIFDTAQVNVELVSGYLTITQPREVTMYAETFAELANHAAYGAKARSMIMAVMDTLG